MKKFYVGLIFFLLTLPISGQTPTTLTFTANFYGLYRPLDSIYIENLTQGGDTMLYWNDTVLLLDYGIGTGEMSMQSEIFTLLPAYPNPFSQHTDISLSLSRDEKVTLKVFDLNGRLLLLHSQLLKAGCHSFQLRAGKERFCFLSVETSSHHQVQKLINYGESYSRYCIDYKGSEVSEPELFREVKNGLVWAPGDQLLFIGFADIDLYFTGHDLIEDNPANSENYEFILEYGAPCIDNIYVTDIDNNRYRTVLIGGLCWMRANLKTTRYSDGTHIPNLTDQADWCNDTIGARGYYNNDSLAWADIYGALYNWHAVDNEFLCPTGWKVPDDDEWTDFLNFLGGASIAGGALKESDTTLWISPNFGATNSSGFSARPGGYRSYQYGLNHYFQQGSHAQFWTSSRVSPEYNSWMRSLSTHDMMVTRYIAHRNTGLSVRCIKE